MTAKNQIPLIAKGTDAKTLQEDLETKLKDMKKTLGTVGKQVESEVEVLFYLNDAAKGGISGKGKDFKEAYKNAMDNSPIEITDAYKTQVTGTFMYQLNKEEEKKAKTKSKGGSAGPRFDNKIDSNYTFG